MKKIFLDTNVFVSGLLESSSDPACHAILDALAARRLRSCVTAWHCCLEFFSITTRLPLDYRLSPEAAVVLMVEHIFDKVEVSDLPVEHAIEWMRKLAGSHARGGLIYDAHIAQVAHHSGCALLVTHNTVDFRKIAPHGVEVLNPREFVERMM